MLGDSREYRALRRAVEKAGGDPEAARRFVARLDAVRDFDAVPHAARAAALALIGGR